MEPDEKCSKCDGELDTEGAPKWCKTCRAKYQRDYQKLRLEMQGGKQYGKGVSDMRDLLATEFERLGSGGFSGTEVAHLIRQAPGPGIDKG